MKVAAQGKVRRWGVSCADAEAWLWCRGLALVLSELVTLCLARSPSSLLAIGLGTARSLCSCQKKP